MGALTRIVPRWKRTMTPGSMAFRVVLQVRCAWARRVWLGDEVVAEESGEKVRVNAELASRR